MLFCLFLIAHFLLLSDSDYMKMIGKYEYSEISRENIYSINVIAGKFQLKTRIVHVSVQFLNLIMTNVAEFGSSALRLQENKSFSFKSGSNRENIFIKIIFFALLSMSRSFKMYSMCVRRVQKALTFQRLVSHELHHRGPVA